MRIRPALLVVAALVTGCTADGEPAPPGPTGTPGGRDMNAVLAALRPVDPCAAIAATAATHAPGTAPAPSGPHRCSVTLPTGVTVRIVIGQWRHLVSQATETKRDLGGVKAYEAASGVGSGRSCRVAIPVSHQLAISVSADGEKVPDLCGPATLFATNLVLTPADKPATRWDACGLLTRALGSEVGGNTVEFSQVSLGIDGCTVGTGPANKRVYSLSLSFKAPGDLVGTADATVAGKRARVQDFRTDCYLEWDNGTSGISRADRSALIVTVNAPTCDRARSLADQVVTTFDSAPPADAAPQRPLTYRPDEPDMP